MSDRAGHSERNKMRGKTAMKMNGARILVEELIHQGVRVIFGYPGGAVLDIYNELYLASDRIGHVLAAHEQGAAHAADGYARASGKTGVVLATSGPGATNLVTGIANAYLDSVPMVAITGNVAVNSLGKDSFQEVDICIHRLYYLTLIQTIQPIHCLPQQLSVILCAGIKSIRYLILHIQRPPI